MLARTRRALAGTYFAEQVASARFDLVNVSHERDDMSRPGTKGSMTGREEESQSAPGSSSGRRRRIYGDGNKCTLLPALANIDPLLDAGDDPITNTPSVTTWESKPEVKDKREKHLHRIDRTSARLCRGERPKIRRGAQGRGTPSDMEVVATLTQPLAYFPKNAMPGTLRPLSKSKRKHNTYQDAVQAGLAGTDMACRLRRKCHTDASFFRQDPHQSASTLRSCSSVKSLVTTEIAVVPEDPVEAYFNTNMQNEKSNFPAEDGTDAADYRTTLEGPRGSRSATAQPEDTKAQRERTSTSEIMKDKVARISRFGSANDVDLASVAAEHLEVSLVTKADEVDPHTNILESFMPSQKMSQLRREAAQSLRMFVFGNIGTEGKKALTAKDCDRIIREKVGTKHQVHCVHSLWDKLDDDASGFVDMSEFKAFVDTAMKRIGDLKNELARSALDGVKPNLSCSHGFSLEYFQSGTTEENAKFAAKMCDRLQQALLGKKETFVLEDLLRIVWPCSTNADLKVMRAWCRENAISAWRSPTPRKLAKDELEALSAVFRFFDNDSSGSVTIEELILSGLMDKETATRYMAEVDGPDGDGELNMMEFCELFCPTGFRAHSRAEKGTDETGQRLVFDERVGGWRLEDMDPGSLFS